MIEVSGANLKKTGPLAGGAFAGGRRTNAHHRWLAGLLALSAASAAHAAGEVIADAYFKQDPRTVSSLMANICMDRQATVVEQDEYHVLCSKEKSGMKGAMVKALMSTQDSAAPGKKIRFTIASSPYGTRVQVSQSNDMPMAFNQFGSGGSDSGKARSQMQAALVAAGGSLTPPPTEQTAAAPMATTAPPEPMAATAPPDPANPAPAAPPANCGFVPCAPQ